MTRKLITFFIVIFNIVIASEVNGQEQGIASGFRTSDKPDSSRFVVDISQKPDYKISSFNNPPHIIIDIKNTKWGTIEDAPKFTKRIDSVRFSNDSNANLQIFLDIKEPFSIEKHFILPPKNSVHRLVVDIAPLATKQAIVTNTQQKIPIPQLKTVKKTIIAIDAGHGGHDPGATGYHGSKEKNITLAYAYAIKQVLENTGRYEVVMTRMDDRYVDLKQRVTIARQSQAKLFLSIHADAHANRQISGLSIYTLAEKASDKEAEALAHKENNAGILNEVGVQGETEDVTALLIDLVQRETKNLSANFAENIILQARHETEILPINPHRFAGFKVLTAPEIPSALLELGYLSNKKEETILLSPAHRKKLAEAILRAIDEHFEKYL